MKHANDESKQHGINQPTWQATLVAMRQGDMDAKGNLLPCDQRKANPSFRKSGNAFDAVAENRFTYGKAGHTTWDFDKSKATGAPATSKAERKDKRESGKHVFAWTPAVRPCDRVAAQPCGITAVWKGDRVDKRFYVTVTDPSTMEEKQILVTLTTNIVSVLSYGQIIEFSMSSRSKGTFGDSRQLDATGKPKRHPLSFAKSELHRMLGVTVGNEAYLHLATLPPKRPTAPTPDSGKCEHNIPMADGCPRCNRNPDFCPVCQGEWCVCPPLPRSTAKPSQGSTVGIDTIAGLAFDAAGNHTTVEFDAQGIRIPVRD